MERKVSLVNRALASHTAHLNFNSHTPIWFSKKCQELSLKQSQEYVLWTAISDPNIYVGRVIWPFSVTEGAEFQAAALSAAWRGTFSGLQVSDLSPG